MIPQTLLWVGLIVAWLVVLVPMLAARHPRVNQVSDATLKTRLLHRGGSATRAVRRRIRPAATVVAEDARVDDEARPGDGDAAPEDDTLEERLIDEEAEAHAYVDSDVDDLHGLSPMDGDTTPIPTVERAAMAERTKVVDLDDLAPESAPVVRRVSAPEQGPAAVVEAPEPVDAGIDAELESEIDSEVEDSEAAELVDEAPEEPADEDLADEELIDADEQLTEEIDPVARPARVGDVDPADRRRRGGYDPENDARLTEARFRFRQRVTLVLGVLAVVALGAGLMNVPYAWFGLGAVVVALGLYLTYLRRTVRIETEIRRRRTARLERARREREREAEVRDGVPAHLRRGGCVVMEIDDEDPAFDHLPRYRAEEFDFLDRPADLPVSYERKVG